MLHTMATDISFVSQMETLLVTLHRERDALFPPLSIMRNSYVIFRRG